MRHGTHGIPGIPGIPCHGFMAPGTPVELGHLQQAREFLDEIRQDLIGGRWGAGLGKGSETDPKW